MTPRNLSLNLLLLTCLLAAGCEIPAQTFWSPDGTRAAYLSTVKDQARAVLIDEQGKVVTELGTSTGGFVWSADSRRLYFATVGKRPQGDRPFEVGRVWTTAEPEPAANAEEAKDADACLIINVLENGQVTPLFWLDRHLAWHLRLSPDGKWLALMSVRNPTGEGDKDQLFLYVFSLETEKLHLLSVACSKGMCFTGPNRLAFVEPNEVKGKLAAELGLLVEVDLDDKVEQLPRSVLALVLMPVTHWLEAAGEDILMSSYQFTFPNKVPENKDIEGLYQLFRVNRDTKKITQVTEDIGEMFLLSPDGKYLLLDKLAFPRDEAKRHSRLALMEMESGAIHILRDLPGTGGNGLLAFPAWRGNREITFTAPETKEKDDRLYSDLVLYRLTDKFELEAVRNLSEKWQLEMRPSVKKQ
jgi:hypothetical protein